jgi:hypothetical protein
MTKELPNHEFEQPINEWLALTPNELAISAISLWHVSVAGEHRFNLRGSKLANFIRRGIVALLDAGAIPVNPSKGTRHEWIAVHHYGQETEVISAAILTEWAASSKDENYLFGIWFALPSKQVGNLDR